MLLAVRCGRYVDCRHNAARATDATFIPAGQGEGHDAYTTPSPAPVPMLPGQSTRGALPKQRQRGSSHSRVVGPDGDTTDESTAFRGIARGLARLGMVRPERPSGLVANTEAIDRGGPPVSRPALCPASRQCRFPGGGRVEVAPRLPRCRSRSPQRKRGSIRFRP